MKIKIAIAEDNALHRRTFAEKMARYPEAELLFTAVNGNDCLAKLKSLSPAEMPEVIFSDLEMPQTDGVEMIRTGKLLYSNIHFIVLSVFDDDEKIFEAIRAGASGYLLKQEPAEVIMEAVTNVLQQGGAPMSPGIARKTLRLLSNPPQASAAQSGGPDSLSVREKEILEYVVSGWEAQRIADTLFLSVLTVRKHIANIYEKLHISSRMQAMHLANKGKWFEK